MDDRPDRLTDKQLLAYAEDLSALYKSEKEKRAQLKSAYEQLKKYAADLGATIEELRATHHELKESYLDTIKRLVLAAEYKDEDTGDHIIRMSGYCALLARRSGLPDDQVEVVLYAAPMHDVGKIGIPDSILLKPGRLTEEEFEVIKTHTGIGAKILAGSKSEILQMAHLIALTHHEKWDGSGYPRGISGEKIPLVGRIVALADVFDALTSRRPYKEPFPIERAVGNIKEGRAKHFDPALVDLFLESLDEIIEIKDAVEKGETGPQTDSIDPHGADGGEEEE